MPSNGEPDYETEITAIVPEHLEPNWYEFTYMKCQRTEHKSPDTGETRPTYTHHWRGEDNARLQDGDSFLLRQITGRSPTPKSNLGKLVLALTGRTVKLGDALSLVELEGKRARLLLDVNEAGYNSIEKVMSVSTAAAKPMLAEDAAEKVASAGTPALDPSEALPPTVRAIVEAALAAQAAAQEPPPPTEPPADDLVEA